MSESNDIYKITVFIGFVLFFATMITQPWVYIGQPLPPESTWGQFASQASSFPTFNNPFAAQSVNFDMAPAGIRNDSAPSYVVNGTMAAFWEVLTDANESTYVGMDAAKSTLRFNMSSTPTDYLLTGWSLEIWCRSNGTTAYFWPELQNQADNADLVMYLISANGVVACPAGPTWSKITVGGQQAEGLTMGNVSQLIFRIHKSDKNGVGRSTPPLEFAFVKMTVTGVSAATCSSPPGAWFPWADQLACSVSQGLVAAWRVFGLFVGGLIFLGQMLVWFVGEILIFVMALGSIFSIPGTPPIISSLFGVLIIGLLFFVAMVFMGKIRGTGNAG